MRPIYLTETPSEYRLSFGYHPRLVEQIKRIGLYIPGQPKWNRSEKAWTVAKRESLDPGKDAKWLVETFVRWAICQGLASEAKESEAEDERDYDLPAMLPLEGRHHMLLEPYGYQLEGIRYALDHKRCIFGDQPGLGKSLQAICAVVKAHVEEDVYGESYPVLVVCPASLKINWQREFKKFAGIDAVILDNKNKDTWQDEVRRKDGEWPHPVAITNYESLKKFFVAEIKPTARFTMSSIKFDERMRMFNSVVIDESHKCKSSRTKQSKFVEGICRGKRWVFALTGTPVVNDNTDLIQQLKILDRLEDFGGYRKFVDTFCSGPRQSSNLKRLNYQLRMTCFFRREKRDVLEQLPDKTRQYITCDITTRAEYRAAETDIVGYMRRYKDADDEKIARTLRGEVMVRLGQLKAISARGKVKAVAEFVRDIVDGGEKFILFAFLKEVVEELKREFPDAVTVTGSDDMRQKQEAVDRFQNDPECRLIILNYKSGGTGLTLTAASRVGFIEFPWTYSDCEQAEDRAHRNGQKNAVNCYYFLGDRTIDSYMHHVVSAKRKIADEVTGTETRIKEDAVNICMNLFKDRL